MEGHTCARCSHGICLQLLLRHEGGWPLDWGRRRRGHLRQLRPLDVPCTTQTLFPFSGCVLMQMPAKVPRLQAFQSQCHPGSGQQGATSHAHVNDCEQGDEKKSLNSASIVEAPHQEAGCPHLQPHSRFLHR